MKELAYLRECLALYFPPECFSKYKPAFKRSNSHGALLITDAPRHMEHTDGIRILLEKDGYTITGSDVWQIEPPASFYRLPFPERFSDCPADPSFWSAYTLMRMILTHPNEYKDPCAARMLIKAMERGNGQTVCRRLLALQAALLKKKVPLDRLLVPWLNHYLGVSVLC